MTDAKQTVEGAPHASSTPPTDHSVSGTFSDPDRLRKTVEALMQARIPTDEIDVYLVDETGGRGRHIEVPREPGTLRGALIGAAVGGAAGLVFVILALAGVFGDPGTAPFGATSLLGAVRAIGGAAAMGVPLGAVLGLGHWQGLREIPSSAWNGGSAMIVIHTVELAEVARRVLRDGGAERVTG